LDKKALGTLVREHQVRIYRLLRYLGADDHLAQDLAQETFLVACRKDIVSDKGIADVAAYLRGVARNLFLDHCRRIRNCPIQVDSQIVEQASAFWESTFLRDGDGGDYVTALRQCLHDLPPKARGMLDLQYNQKKSRSEMAAEYGMSEDGIKSAMRRVRAVLARCIHGKIGLAEATGGAALAPGGFDNGGTVSPNGN
jgi:RNA polymerase sigma-70 factor (ECF subfamily)